MGRTQAMQIPKGLLQVPLQEKRGFHSILCFTPLILRWLLHFQEDGAATTLVLQFQESLHTLALLLGQFAEKVTHTLQGHRGPQLHVNQAVDGGLHRGRIILTNLGAHDWSVVIRS